MKTQLKQPKLGSLWVKQEHLSEHNRIVAGLKATIQMLLSQSFGAAKSILELENEVKKSSKIISKIVPISKKCCIFVA